MTVKINANPSPLSTQVIDNQYNTNKLNEVANLVINILNDDPAPQPLAVTFTSNLYSTSYVSSIPERRMIVWNEEAFMRLDLPTAVFWTLFEQLNVRSYGSFNQIVADLAADGLKLEEAVAKFEKIEHDNALKAKALMLSAIFQKKVNCLPDDCQAICSDFSSHYRFQQLKGHSQKIAARLASLCPQAENCAYKGTWKININKLDNKQEQQLEDLFKLKLQLETPETYEKALLKLGCNIKLAERLEPLGTGSFLKQASQEIFSPQEFDKALLSAEKFLINRRNDIVSDKIGILNRNKKIEMLEGQ
jgi:hypothetical protein